MARTTLPAVDVADELLHLAGLLDAAALVLGADERGHVTHEVMRHARCAVVVAPEDELLLPARVEAVGVAFDGSIGSRFALFAAQRLAVRAGARLDVITVVGDERRADAARTSVESAAAGVEWLEVRSVVLHGDAAHELRRACEDLDFLACGSRRHGAVRERLLGSVSSKLIADPVCPVLVAPVRALRDAAAPLGITTAGGT